MTTPTTLYAVHAISLEDPADYDKRFESFKFLGVRASLDEAKALALEVAEFDRIQFNEEIMFGEAPLPETELAWAVDYKDSQDREILRSDSLEILDAFYFQIQPTDLP